VPAKSLDLAAFFLFKKKRGKADGRKKRKKKKYKIRIDGIIQIL